MIERLNEMLELNNLYNMDYVEGLKQLDDTSVDLIVTSPLYNNPYNRKKHKYNKQYLWQGDIE